MAGLGRPRDQLFVGQGLCCNGTEVFNEPDDTDAALSTNDSFLDAWLSESRVSK